MDAAALREDARTLGRNLRRAIPDTYPAYGRLHGALSASAKELIALAVAVTRECDGCIAAHAEGAARSGATADEVAETMGVAILMNGGPATRMGPPRLPGVPGLHGGADPWPELDSRRPRPPQTCGRMSAHSVDRLR